MKLDLGTLCLQRSPAAAPPAEVRSQAPVEAPPPTKAEVQEILESEGTDIEALVKAFAADITAEAAALAAARLKQQAADPSAKPAVNVVTFALSPTKESKVRTPEEQAEQVAKNRSWVCWGAHMSNRARHVLMKVNGKVSWDARVALGNDFEAFKTKWGEVMAKHGLKNFEAGDGWAPGDEFHLELPNSRMAHDDKRAQACLAEYARLTRAAGQSKNVKFEGKYQDLLKPYVGNYDHPAGDRHPSLP